MSHVYLPVYIKMSLDCYKHGHIQDQSGLSQLVCRVYGLEHAEMEG